MNQEKEFNRLAQANFNYKTEMRKVKDLSWEEAMIALDEGLMVKLPEWDGYWFGVKDDELEKNIIKVMTGSGDVLETPYTEDNVNRTDWEITDGLRTFGGALKAVKNGKMIARKGWNGKKLFVFQQVPAIISVDKTVPVMQSLPQSVKTELMLRRNEFPEMEVYETIKYSNQLALVKSNNEINGWSPSTSDALANDWFVL